MNTLTLLSLRAAMAMAGWLEKAKQHPATCSALCPSASDMAQGEASSLHTVLEACLVWLSEAQFGAPASGPGHAGSSLPKAVPKGKQT